MRLRLGCELRFEVPQPTPLIALLNVHYSQVPFLERPDVLTTDPPVPLDSYRDGFGNWCTRLVLPPGQTTLGTDGVIHVDGALDPQAPDAVQHAVETLPPDTLPFILPSRYCDSDRLSDEAWEMFGQTTPGWPRVEAVCRFVHNHIHFDYAHARPTRTALDAYREGVGVCRDFAHLAIAFCRSLNIPARYCNGYISDHDQPPPRPPMDFCAWMEVWLGGAWHTFDPRNLVPRRGRVLISRGRDAADVPLTHSFGQADLIGFRVWIDPVEP